MTPPIIDFTDRNSDHYFLSNYSPYRVRVDGVTYATSEHAYQAHRAKDRWTAANKP